VRHIPLSVGQRFGKLKVIALSEKIYENVTKTGYKILRPYWVCLCDCGKECVVVGGSLNSGQTKSCGCFRLEVFTSEEYRASRRGVAPPNKQIKCFMNCEQCGALLLRSKRQLRLLKHVWCNGICQNKWQRQNTDFAKFSDGENNWSYKDGSRVGGKMPNYGTEFDKVLKREIKLRDRYTCQECLVSHSGEKSKRLDIHHIDADKFNNAAENLVTLCKACHLTLHWMMTKDPQWVSKTKIFNSGLHKVPNFSTPGNVYNLVSIRSRLKSQLT
jgi:5-methylcytosine-specific restriction endonuclease McrA